MSGNVINSHRIDWPREWRKELSVHFLPAISGFHWEEIKTAMKTKRTQTKTIFPLGPKIEKTYCPTTPESIVTAVMA